MSKFKPMRVEKNSSAIGTPLGIEPKQCVLLELQYVWICSWVTL